MATKLDDLIAEIPTDKIDPKHLRFVVRALHGVGDRWEGMGNYMDVKDLAEIRQNYPDLVTRRLIAMVDSLLRGRFNTQPGTPASWQTIAIAVKENTGGGNPQLARLIAKKLNEFRAFSPGPIALPVDTSPFVEESVSEGTRVKVVAILHQLLAPVASRWFEMGALFSLPLNSLTTIKNDPAAPRDVDKLGRVIEEWLTSETSREMECPCWQVLVDVVAHGAGGDDPGLACHIAEKSKTVKLPSDPLPPPVKERAEPINKATVKSSDAANKDPPLVKRMSSTGIGTLVEPEHVGDLAVLLHPIASNWDLFLGQLEVPDPKRKDIAASNWRQPSTCKSLLITGLKQLATSSKPPTIDSIASVLEGPTVTNKPIARNIRALGIDNNVMTASDVDWLVRDYLYKIAAHWEMFLSGLGMDRSEVKQISGANDITMKCLLDGLHLWAVTADYPTYEQISLVLRGTVVTNVPLAREIEKFARRVSEQQGPGPNAPQPQVGVYPGRRPPRALHYTKREPLPKEFNLIRWKDDSGKEQMYRLRDAVSHEWKRLGDAFGFGVGVMKAIGKTNRDDTMECWDAVMARWLQDGSDVTWGGLISALEEVGGFGNELTKLCTALEKQIIIQQ